MPHKVLIANRGEIAVRIVRACRDAAITSVAVYAEADRDAPHVQLADEAHALGGDTAATSYLHIPALLAAAAAAHADAIHPGYGFLAENAEFAEAVLAAGLVWIGPPPHAVRALGDKVSARRIARAAGAPLAPGLTEAVRGPAEITAFARAHGLPIAIKAVFGGGGRGMKVARTLAEIDERYDSAVREARAAFGHGECFVERYLDRPRHVETQCLADRHGNVVVLGTRDCSLQRRHQKLVEEAPAPFLTDDQRELLSRASRDILRAAGYVGAGTCEFLLAQDGTISFLEVNTRLQVEHPVTEEVCGVDLVREMFRLADGDRIGYDDPPVRGHSIEFRINAEDPGRGFLPVPGTVERFEPPAGPGVRLDAGVSAGSVVGPAWDSLLGKLVITGATRRQALERARRALAEFTVDGVATVLPFHRAVVEDPAFAPETHGRAGPFRVHTRWIETEFANTFSPWEGPAGEPRHAGGRRETVVVEVGGRRLAVTLPAELSVDPAPSEHARRPAHRAHGGGRPGPRVGAVGDGPALTAPMQGTVVRVAVEEGQRVGQGDLVVILEAMKMEQPLHAHRAGAVRGLAAALGAPLAAGALVCEIHD